MSWDSLYNARTSVIRFMIYPSALSFLLPSPPRSLPPPPSPPPPRRIPLWYVRSICRRTTQCCFICILFQMKTACLQEGHTASLFILRPVFQAMFTPKHQNTYQTKKLKIFVGVLAAWNGGWKKVTVNPWACVRCLLFCYCFSDIPVIPYVF